MKLSAALLLLSLSKVNALPSLCSDQVSYGYSDVATLNADLADPDVFNSIGTYALHRYFPWWRLIGYTNFQTRTFQRISLHSANFVSLLLPCVVFRLTIQKIYLFMIDTVVNMLDFFKMILQRWSVLGLPWNNFQHRR